MQTANNVFSRPTSSCHGPRPWPTCYPRNAARLSTRQPANDRSKRRSTRWCAGRWNGYDVGNDGEHRAWLSEYVRSACTALARERSPTAKDCRLPGLRRHIKARRRSAARIFNARRLAEVQYTDLSAAEDECAVFSHISERAPESSERFMTAASPGIIADDGSERPLRVGRGLRLRLAEEMRGVRV